MFNAIVGFVAFNYVCQIMTLSRTDEPVRTRRTIAVLTSLCLLYAILLPVPPHVKSVLTTIQEHAAFIESHGHSHGFEEDLAAALHGHSHDATDHDHSVATLVTPVTTHVPVSLRGDRRWVSEDRVATRHYRIERPPRV